MTAANIMSRTIQSIEEKALASTRRIGVISASRASSYALILYAAACILDMLIPPASVSMVDTTPPVIEQGAQFRLHALFNEDQSRLNARTYRLVAEHSGGQRTGVYRDTASWRTVQAQATHDQDIVSAPIYTMPTEVMPSTPGQPSKLIVELEYLPQFNLLAKILSFHHTVNADMNVVVRQMPGAPVHPTAAPQ